MSGTAAMQHLQRIVATNDPDVQRQINAVWLQNYLGCFAIVLK